ncbi:MAG: hypothetical protein HOB78_11170 [Flavobacteriales bacterium]|nr:hypothetical protein [Flavobacteriales bacterium]
MSLKEPIHIAFQDSRLSPENSLELIQSLKSGLKEIYGSNIVFTSYFDKPPENNILLRINIKEIGSNFGTRTIKYQSYRNKITAASSSVSTYWGSAVSTAIISQPVVQNQYLTQGYWVGTSYLEITLLDNFHDSNGSYEFPFVAEDFQNNTWGYKSGSIAAQNSWNKVASHLLSLIDSIAIKMIEENG